MSNYHIARNALTTFCAYAAEVKAIVNSIEIDDLGEYDAVLCHSDAKNALKFAEHFAAENNEEPEQNYEADGDCLEEAIAGTSWSDYL